MTIKVGERLPNATLRLVTPDGPKSVETKDYFAGNTVVLFGLPGAFTPTCHKNHLPGFIVNEARFKEEGVDKIAMTAVNDHHVLKAWAEATGATGHVDFLADGNGDFAKAVGLDLDLSAGGLGLRSKRYSMLVVDGVVKLLNVEPDAGKVDFSGALDILAQIK
jgi:glutaredoxin/glutathione-dependent peroxiredoxin